MASAVDRRKDRTCIGEQGNKDGRETITGFINRNNSNKKTTNSFSTMQDLEQDGSSVMIERGSDHQSMRSAVTICPSVATADETVVRRGDGAILLSSSHAHKILSISANESREPSMISPWSQKSDDITEEDQIISRTGCRCICM